MFTIIWRTILDRKVSVIAYSLAGILFMWMFVGLYPSIKENTAEFDELLKAYPQELIKAFGIEELSFDTLERFLAVEQYSITWPLMAVFMVVSFAGMALAREIEKGTAEILLSRPVSRLTIFFSKYIAGIKAFAIFTIVSIFSVVPLAEMYNIDYSLENQAKTALLGFLFGLAIFSFSYMLSAMFSERSKAYMISGGVLILMYVLKIMSSLEDNLENLKYASFFHYFDANKTLIYGEIDTTSVLVFLGVTVVCTVIGAIWFNKRDIAI
ncbi:ABC transporter permease [Patescibacteria group bacterium]|nr:ABC transporter permease [Patescibacteria group bacterium]